MKQRVFGLVLVVAVMLCASTRSEAKKCPELAASYGFAVFSNLFGPWNQVDLGAITLKCDGSLDGIDSETYTPFPYPSDAQPANSTFPITGTWTVDDDGINGTITSDAIGGLNFVVDDDGDVLRLTGVGGLYQVGRAVRQDPKYIAKLVAGKIKGRPNDSLQCTGYNPNVPFPEFPAGVPVSIQGTEVTNKNGYLFKGVASGNFFSNSLTSTTPPAVTNVNTDGTGSGTDGFGTPFNFVATAPGQDFFTVSLVPDFLGYCTVHPRDNGNN